MEPCSLRHNRILADNTYSKSVIFLRSSTGGGVCCQQKTLIGHLTPTRRVLDGGLPVSPISVGRARQSIASLSIYIQSCINIVFYCPGASKKTHVPHQWPCLDAELVVYGGFFECHFQGGGNAYQLWPRNQITARENSGFISKFYGTWAL
jgi:hypothetical protein